MIDLSWKMSVALTACALPLALASCTFKVEGNGQAEPVAPIDAVEPTQTPQSACRLGEGSLGRLASIETNLEGAFAVVSAPAGQGAFAVATGREVGLWSFAAETPRLQAVIAGPESGSVYVAGTGCAVAYAANASRLAIGSTDGAVALWDAAAHVVIARLAPQGNRVRALAVSDDGSLVAVADQIGAIRLWTPETGEVMRAPQDFQASALTFVPGQRDLLVAGRSIAGWSSLELLQRWSYEGGFSQSGQCNVQAVEAVAPTPNGADVVAVGGSALARFDAANLATRVPATVAESHDPDALTMSADGAMFATVGREGTLRLWRTATMTEIARADVALQIGVVFDATGEHVATIGRDGTLHVFGCTP